LSSDQPTTPKWLSIVFKLYGAFALIIGIFSIATILISSNFESLTSVIDISLITLGIALSSFALAYVSWKLQHWTIYIIAIMVMTGLYSFFTDFSEGFFALLLIPSAYLIVSIVFLIIVLYYRKHFEKVKTYFSSSVLPRLFFFGLLLTVLPGILSIFFR